MLNIFDDVVIINEILRNAAFGIFESLTKIALFLLPFLNSILKGVVGLISQIPIVGPLIASIGNPVTGLLDQLTPGVQGVITGVHNILEGVFLFINVTKYDILFPDLRNVLTTVLGA